MRIVVIGATGHIGTFLVPRLVERGHKVVALSRGDARAIPATRRLAVGRANRVLIGLPRTTPAHSVQRVANRRSPMW